MAGTRRELLTRGFVLIGAAVGVGTAAKAVTDGGGGSPSSRPVTSRAEEIRLHGQQWHLSSSTLRPGQLPDRGHRFVGDGVLVDRPGGDPVGHFFSTSFAVESPGRTGPEGVNALEFHTLSLADGSILGSGTVSAGLDREDEFAIIGGTGRYVGARGSYLARQQPHELGGDGTAEFRITLIPEEARDGGR